MSKDWTGNSNSIYKQLGASNHTEDEREENDYYATDPKAIDELLKVEDFGDVIFEPACVDKDTEYFNGYEWIKISEYKNDDKVLCFDGKNGILLNPIKYVKLPYEDDFYHYKGRYLDMSLTLNHKVIYYNRRKNILENKSFEEILKYYDSDSNGFRGLIPTSFYINSKNELENINEWELRLAVAVNADGKIISEKQKTYYIRVKKERKRDRLIYLLSKAGIEYKLTIESDAYYRFKFKSPLGCKKFPKEWIYLPLNLKLAFIDEISKWDGNEPDKYSRFYFSSKKDDIDLVQMIINSSGLSTNIDVDIRDSRPNNHPNYRMSILRKNKFSLSKKPYYNIYKEKSEDGYCYCFTVDTGMLILRRNNKIFITGNCGEGNLSKRMEDLGKVVISSDLVDRGYGETGVDFLKFESDELLDMDIITNPPYKFTTEFILKSLSIIKPGRKVAFFLKLQTLEGQGRYKDVFSKYPPISVNVCTKRIQCAKNNHFVSSSAVCYAWFVWEKDNYSNPPIIRWINT